jgi:hypothetical protein
MIEWYESSRVVGKDDKMLIPRGHLVLEKILLEV